MNHDNAASAYGPHLGFLYNTDVPDAFAVEFEKAVAAEELDLLIERRQSQQIYAGIEWLMPTAVIAYVAKSYFDGFLKEMGKEHYLSLKSALKSLADRLRKVKVTQIGTPGKIPESPDYSLVFSICFDRSPEGSFKFLIPTALDPDQFDRAMAALFDLMEIYLSESADSADRAEIHDKMTSARPYGGTVLLAFDPGSGEIGIIDPLSKISVKG